MDRRLRTFEVQLEIGEPETKQTRCGVPGSARFPWQFAVVLASMALLVGCGPKQGENGLELNVEDGRIVVVVAAPVDTVMGSINHVLLQERIALRRFVPEEGLAESGFVDIARYRDFDRELWDDSQRLIKMRFYATARDSTTVFLCEPLYNPYEVLTDEADFTHLRLIPPGHPGFDIAAALTRRIAAHALGRAVTRP